MWYIILSVIIAIFFYTTINLLRKVEKLEDAVEAKDSFIEKVQESISISEKKLEEIDGKGFFKSDDEIGWFFENIKYIQETLSQYKNN